MKLDIQKGLPFVSVDICFRGTILYLEKVLIDTGSATTILNANRVEVIGVIPEMNDIVDAIRGVGGVEYVYTKDFDFIQLENALINHFQVEIGNMDYGLDIDGILGFDFISAAGLIIDTKQMIVYTS
jgi:septum formation inhibitor-activating ATPase MinD